MLKVLDLFSGIGGFSLGLEATGGFETVGFCEIEPYPRAVLAKHWPDVPIYDDVRTLEHDGPIDVICGGYPCQPFSVAGKRRGAEDDRHLWPAMFALIQRHRPAWVIGENVAGHINMGLDEVLSDLESEGYAARAFVIPACAVDAPHRRDRVWVLGNSHRSRPPRDNSRRAQPAGGRADVADAACKRCGEAGELRAGSAERPPRSGETLAHPDSKRTQGEQSCITDTQRRAGQVGRQAGPRSLGGGSQWATEPGIRRVVNGLPNRAHRIKALGNAVVPQVVEMIGRAILAAHYLSPNEGEEDGQSEV